jgi:hypothetical protein
MMSGFLESGPRRCRWWRAALPALMLALLAGCVSQEEDGQESRYRYEYWVPAAVGLVGAITTPAGWFLRPRIAKFGWTLLILGPAAFLIGMPSMFCDRVNVNDQGFHVRTGFYGTTAKDVEFDQVNAVRLISETSSGRRQRTSYHLLFDMKTGGEPVKVALGNELVKTAAPTILQRLSARGVRVVDER